MLISYGYDLNGNKKSVTDATGKTTYYEYDMADRLISISECNKKLAEYSYTPYGKVSKVVCGDIITDYEYDPDGRYGRIKVTVGESVLSDIHYGYDNKGNCIRKVNVTGGVNSVTDYKYDGVGRLTGVKRPDLEERYSYDRAGNRITYANDKGISESYNYNETNELLSIEKSPADGGISEVIKFTYDADGNMTSDGRLIRFIYSGKDAVCEEEEEKGFTRYIRGNGRLVASDSESARTYYHYACDSLGSVDYVIAGNEFGCDGNYGGTNQRILCRYGYDAFGNTVDAFENVGNRYGFTGEMRDDVTGMYYLRARYYSSGIGRFTQADTYHGDGLNLYVYAGNNPVRYVDPSGHCCKNGSGNGSDSNYNIDVTEMKKYIIPPEEGHQAYIERTYIEIRKMGLDDIPIVAKNTGLTEEEILNMKKHLFLDTHYLSIDGKPYKELYFQGDSEVAYAWKKAQKGELNNMEKEWFRQLANHELTEKELMDKGMPLRDQSTWIPERFLDDPTKNAHDLANITAPQPKREFPGHDFAKEFLKYTDDEIDY